MMNGEDQTEQKPQDETTTDKPAEENKQAEDTAGEGEAEKAAE